MDDLVQFLRDRLNDDDAVARAADTELSTVFTRIATFDPEMAADERHIMQHRPARVLREVEARRGLLKRYEEPETSSALSDSFNKLSAGVERDSLIEVFRYLALPYADHPDYREDWRP